ncbi:MAG: hypothetical protein KDD89_05700 [Anaerolineales bacterium]|nr:hypothetical protein [Anaerolineales bacterium]
MTSTTDNNNRNPNRPNRPAKPKTSDWAEFGRIVGRLTAVVAFAIFGLLFARYTALGQWLALFAPYGEQTAWFLTRSTALMAYLFLSASTAWGILLSTKIIKEAVPPPVALEMHNTLSWLALGFTAVHAFLLLFDTYFTYTIADLLIPFIGPYEPLWVGLGTISLYLMLFINLSFYLRKQLGQQLWRLMHYSTFLLYIGATVHGFMAGSDSGLTGMRLLYLSSGLLILFLTNYRLISRQPRPSRASKTA